MRPPSRFLALASPALLLACNDPVPAPPGAEPVDACAATSPVRLAAPPAGWRPDPTYRYQFRPIGDRLLYTFDAPNLSDRTYWLVDRCGGAPVRLASLRTGEPGDVRTIDTDEGTLLYVRDDAGFHHIVDRLDVPGDDLARPVAGLPSGLQAFTPADYLLFALVDPESSSKIAGAAGFGPASAQYLFYTHAGDPDRPAVHLGNDIVDHAYLGDRLLLLHADGALRDVDARTGDGEPLLDGVRYFTLSSDDRRLIWQTLGDDVAEPVHLLDLDTGEDREIAVNDFTTRSWGRDITQPASVGTWSFTRDGAAAVQIGPDRRIVAAVRTDTGEPLAIPDHVRWQNATGDDMLVLLLQDDADERVEAAWTPLTGALRVYYRGPADPRIRFNDGAQLEYYLPAADDPAYGSLHRVDLATGRSVRLAPRVGELSARLDDLRWLAAAAGDFVFDLDLFDPNTQVYYPIADAVDDFTLVRDQGVFYLDTRGPDPGLWLFPLAGG